MKIVKDLKWMLVVVYTQIEELEGHDVQKMKLDIVSLKRLIQLVKLRHNLFLLMCRGGLG